jgi:hypothetical protein
MLDEEGKVIATHQGERTVDGFRETAKSAAEFQEIKSRAEAGDAAAKVDYTIRRAALGQYKLEELKAAVAGLGKLSPEQEEALNGVLANLMVEEVKNTAEAERYLEMEKKGLIPTDDDAAIQFYDTLLRYAAFKKDVAIFERALPELEERLPSHPRAQSYLEFRRKQLQNLKAGNG